MRFQKCQIIITLFSLLFISPIYAADSGESRYKLIRVSLDGETDWRPLQTLDLDIAGFHPGSFFDFFGTKAQHREVRKMGFQTEILLEDPNEAFAELRAKSDFGDYHTYDEITAELLYFQNTYPNLAKRISLGMTHEGRHVWALKISDNVDVEQASEPDVLFIGGLHARELIAFEVPIFLSHYLLSNYGRDPVATFLVDNREIWVVPMLNPDGHAQVVAGNSMWRKNRRNNGDGTFGVDLNRNFGFEWGYDDIGSSPFTFTEIYRGPSAFSEPETQAIKQLAENHEFTVSLTYHSYGRMLLYPWGYIPQNTPDHLAFVAASSETVATNGYEAGNTASGTIYPTNGDSDDYLYGEQTTKPKTLAMTFEIGTRFDPPESQIPILVGEVLGPSVFLAKIAGPYLTLEDYALNDQSGDNDGLADPGETIDIRLTLENKNILDSANDLNVILRSASPDVNIIVSKARFPDIPAGSQMTGQIPLRFKVSPTCPNGTVLRFSVGIQCGRYICESRLNLKVTTGQLLCLHNWTLSTNQGWTIDGGEWAWGQPTGQGGASGFPDPTSGYTGSKVYGTNLNGDYSDSLDPPATLTSEVVDCSELFDTKLQFYRWLNVEGGRYDKAFIQVINDSGSHLIWDNISEVTDSAWTLQEYDISEWADGQQSVQIRFGLGSDYSKHYSGWNIDDIRLCGLYTGDDITATPRPTVTPTETPAPPTSTPTDTPYQEPTQTPSLTGTPVNQGPPTILLGGYWDSSVTRADGGLLKILVYVYDLDGASDIETVQACYAEATIASLADNGMSGDLYAGDGFYGWQLPIVSDSLTTGVYTLEVIATDYSGNQSSIYPYLTIQ